MNYRTLGKTRWKISDVSLGTWQVGGKWGSPFDEKRAEEIIHTAIDHGVNFIDTADVYGDRMSEKTVARVVKQRSERVFVATKIGRRLDPHNVEGYNRENLTRFVEEALQNMELETIDLLQLHCPPTAVYHRPEVFEVLEEMKVAGKIRHYGVSVEKVEEALKAIEYPGLSTVQIIFNMMRLKPAEQFFPAALEKNIGVIVRVPLASGLLTGKFTPETQFEAGDHRKFNRFGDHFDKGETFSGVNYELGVKLAQDHYQRFFGEKYLVQHALRWVLMFDAVSCVIPGASSPEHVKGNVLASETPVITPMAMREVKQVYDEHLRPVIHHQW